MQRNGCPRTIFKILVAMALVLVNAAFCSARQAPSPAGGGDSSQAAVDARALTDSLRSLQDQVRELTAQIKELREEQTSTQGEVRSLRGELSDMRNQLSQPPQHAALTDSASIGPAGSNQDETANAFGPVSPAQSARQPETTEQRLDRLEESQQVTSSNVREISQTKVESGSKYRLRLSGIVLLNTFVNRGTVDNLDIPELALPPTSLSSPGTFGGTLRQSQISLDAFGPDLFGARTSANLSLDFAGGFVATQNGGTKPLVRLRTGTVRFDWSNTSIIAGQDSLFFVPLSPSSLASLAVPALAYAGDLWSWTPQVRIEHRIALAAGNRVLLQGGILDSLTGDVAQATYERYPTWGERSGDPAVAGRAAWSHPAFGDDVTFGVGGYYARQDWGFSRDIDGWAATLDAELPLGKLFEVSGAFYRGRAVGGLGGALGQSILTSGPFAGQGTAIRGLDSAGGWAQLKFKPRTNFEVNGALGVDNPFANQLRQFPATPSYYGILLSRNVSPLVNFIYQPRSDVMFSAEYRHLQTLVVSANSQRANIVDLSLGYTF